MLDLVVTISNAVRSALQRRALRDVLIEPALDSEGADALDVTLVLDDADLSGAEAGRILLSIQTALLEAGDSRFPIVAFTTEDELALDGHPEF